MKKTLIVDKLRMLVIGLIALSQFSCNEEFPNILKEEYKNKEMGVSLNRVLIVVADGIRGNALTDIDPENMRKIARNAFYTNSSLGDYRKEVPFSKATGLANIFTGVNSNKHLVTTDLQNLDTEKYPTLFDRLKSDYEDFNSEAFTTDGAVYDKVFDGVDKKELLNSDEEVLSKVKETIKGTESEMIVAHLSDMYKVGQAHSFESTDLNYRDAILKFDAQMLDLIGALESRPNYKTENWLIVITSSVGGPIAYVDPNDATVFSDHLRNTFTYFYSPSFTRKYQARPSLSSLPFVGSGIRVNFASVSNNATSARTQDGTKMNFAPTQNFTINFFVKQNIENSYFRYPPILMKRAGIDSGNGWQFIMGDLSGTSRVEFGANGINKIKSASIGDAKWHAITVSVNRTANTAIIYTDGVESARTTAGTGDITNNLPMIWGAHTGYSYSTGHGDFTMCNLQIYNVAMTDAQIKSYAGIGLVKADNSPFYNNLLAYWPTYGDNGTRVITDVTGKAGNLQIWNELNWATFDEFVPFFKPDINDGTFRLVPNQVDIPFFVYQWFGVLPRNSWALDGQAWTPPYAVMEY